MAENTTPVQSDWHSIHEDIEQLEDLDPGEICDLLLADSDFGVPGDSERCPLAIRLGRRHRVPIYVTDSLICQEAEGPGYPLRVESSLRVFVRNFDHGYYPELIIGELERDDDL